MQLDDSKRLFVRLLAQHERRVYGYILRLVPLWSDADEVLQETNIRLWEEFDRFVPGTNFAAWAIRVAHYQVLTWRKRQSRSRLVFSDEAIRAIADESAAQLAEVDARQTALAECLKKLSPRNRDMILRCYADGSTIRSVAEQLDRSVDAVYKAAQRIRLTLHRCIEQRLQSEGTT